MLNVGEVLSLPNTDRLRTYPYNHHTYNLLNGKATYVGADLCVCPIAHTG